MSILDRPSLPIVLLVAFSLGIGPAADAAKKKKAKPKKGLALVVTVPSVGMVMTKDENQNMTFKMAIDGKEFLFSQTAHKRYTLEVLAVSTEATTKERITFIDDTKIAFQNGKKQDKPSSVAGKSYIAELKNGAVAITNEDGSAPSAAELTEVQEETKRLGKPDTFGKFLAGKPLELNKKLVISSDQFKEIMGDANKNLDAVDGSLTLIEIRGSNAVLAMEVTVKMTESQMAMEMPMKGTVVVDIKTGWPMEMTLEGPIQGTFQGSPLEGQMKMVMTYSY